MRYKRTELEVEAMPVRNPEGETMYYVIEGLGDRQLQLSPEEFERHFKKVDGRTPRKRERRAPVRQTQPPPPTVSSPAIEPPLPMPLPTTDYRQEGHDQ
jgi:hypothetical protein